MEHPQSSVPQVIREALAQAMEHALRTSRRSAATWCPRPGRVVHEVVDNRLSQGRPVRSAAWTLPGWIAAAVLRGNHPQARVLPSV